MDQDMPHRISAPSRQAPGPRYSLVWKLVLVPKDDHPAHAAVGAGQEGDEQGAAGEGGDAGAGEGTAALLSICRPEWGEPVRLGSASRASGVRARGGGRRPPAV